jgi:hypothetical protein
MRRFETRLVFGWLCLGLMAGVVGCGDDEVPPADAAPEDAVSAEDAAPDVPRPPDDMVWEPFGLAGEVVTELHHVDGALVAVTEGGIHRRHLVDDDDWSLVGFAEQAPQSLAVLSEQDWIVSTADPVALHVTADGGATWDTLDDDFGGEDEETARHLAVDPTDGSLLATGTAVVARSTDGGASWTPLWGDWGAFATGVSVVDVHPVNGDLWAGGQNAIEQAILIHSTDGGGEWTEWLEPAPSPSTVKDFGFHPTDGGHLFVGLEGALLLTEDRGETWQTAIDASDDYRFFFGVEMVPGTPEQVYAAGWVKTGGEPQPLVLFVSQDGGAHWSEHVAPMVEYGGVLTMLPFFDGDPIEIYFGLDGGGVHRLVTTFIPG